MRPTGLLHLGHYFGALENWVKMQDTMECFFAVADWHALTTNYDKPDNIKENTRQLIIDWLSVGIDPNKSTIFVQSHNLAHAVLYLLLGMITPVSWLERTPSYKEIKGELVSKDLANYGFLGYPVLMASDIVLYNSDYVPVGLDQAPHVELAREIVRRFHALYNKKIFVEPQPMLTKLSKLPGLDRRKMSKSYNNSITLGEDGSSVEIKLKQMITDTNRMRRSDPGNPDVCPVFDYHKVFSTEEDRAEICAGCTTAAIGCIDCKKILIKYVLSLLEPIREKRKRYETEIKDVAEFLFDSQAKANSVAEQTIARIKDALCI
jgi:tryptophanyl-tRNA synthetase